MFSTFFPTNSGSTILSYVAPNQRSYYENLDITNNNTDIVSAQTLMRDAINYCKTQIETAFSAADLDVDNDGYVDNISFIVQGDAGGWSDFMWAYKWSLYAVPSFYLHGKRCYDFFTTPEGILDIETLTHEMYHALGAPDFYTYNGGQNYPTLVGPWCVMAGCSGQSSSAYVSTKYGHFFVDTPTAVGSNMVKDVHEITSSGNYQVNDIWNRTNNLTPMAYKIATSNPNEYIWLEYRKKTGEIYETPIPEQGLIIYRTNENGNNANATLQNNIPESYVFRPNAYDNITEGDLNNAHFSTQSGRTVFNSTTNPRPFLTNNSICDNFSIKNISETGYSSMWFDISIKETNVANGIFFNMIKVNGRGFEIGAATATYPAETNAHEVALTDYYIGQTEVTQGLWEAVMGTTYPSTAPSSTYGVGANYPVYFVSWNDIVGTSGGVGYVINGVTYYKNGFCYKLSQLVGGDKKFRLPTEAEWENAARGGYQWRTTDYNYSGSNTLNDVAWYNNNSGMKTHPVGQKQPNEIELYDMTGNVWELCSDWHASYQYYSNGQFATNPTGPVSGTQRVARGESFDNQGSQCRITRRDDAFSPTYRYATIGFRLALSENYNIIATSNPPAGGSITGNGISAAGELCTLTATPNSCYTFDCWKENNIVVSTNSTYTFTAAENRTLVANYTIKTYTVTPVTGNSGSISPSTTQTVNCGNSKQFTATPNSCQEVDKWIVNGNVVQNGGNTYTITNVQTNTTIQVTFKTLFYEITPTAGNGGSILPNILQTVDCGSNQIFIFTADIGYQIEQVLVDWIPNPQAVTDGFYSFTNINAPHSIYVTFTESVGITDIDNYPIKIYPNPTRDEIFIQTDLQIEKVEIYNSIGSLVLTEDNFSGKISVSTLSPSTYTIKIYTNKGVVAKTIIKEK